MNDAEGQFLRLVRDNDARLRRLCRIYAPDVEQRRDLYQDILVQLWRSLESFRGDSSAGTWLYRIALNTALASRRSDNARPDLLHDGELVSRHAGHAGSPGDVVEENEQLERLYAAIATLPDTDKALLLMHLEDTSYREMAEVLGISENHVGVKLHRARQRVAKHFEEHDHAMG